MAHDPGYVRGYGMKARGKRCRHQICGVHRAHAPCTVARVRSMFRPVILVGQGGDDRRTGRPRRDSAGQIREEQCGVQQVWVLRTNDIPKFHRHTQRIASAQSYTPDPDVSESVLEAAVIGSQRDYGGSYPPAREPGYDLEKRRFSTAAMHAVYNVHHVHVAHLSMTESLMLPARPCPVTLPAMAACHVIKLSSQCPP